MQTCDDKNKLNILFHFSLLDQQLKQQLPYTGGRFLNEVEGQVFVVSRKNIYRLNPVSWEKQVLSVFDLFGLKIEPSTNSR